MRQRIAIFSLLIYSLSFTEFHQVLRLPLLVEHYQEHKAKVNSLSFWEFLVLHYQSDVAHDDRDNRLPFKDCGHSIATATVALPSYAIEFVYSVHDTNRPEFPDYVSPLSGRNGIDIFQPPKSVA